jgi:hypothetical protein
MDTVEENWKQFKEAIGKHIPRKKIEKHHDAYTTKARKARNHHTKKLSKTSEA